MSFTEKLALLEMRKGYHRRRGALAEAVGVSKSSLGRWFTGHALPDIQEASKLAKVLGVSVGWLADDTSVQTQPYPFC